MYPEVIVWCSAGTPPAGIASIIDISTYFQGGSIGRFI